MTSRTKHLQKSENREVVALWTVENRKNVLLEKAFIELKNRYAFLRFQPNLQVSVHREMLWKNKR